MKRFLHIGLVIAGLVVINLLAGLFPYRFDLTEDKRYTLSEAAVATVSDLQSPITVDILMDGDLPAEFLRLQDEVMLLLDQFKAENSRISYALVDPLENPNNREQTLQSLQRQGLKPANITIQEEGETSQRLFFPWAIARQGKKTVKVSLLKNTLGATTSERINNSVQQLEYAFADAFTKLGLSDKKKIAVIKGNGELQDIYLADLLTDLKAYYNIGAITLETVDRNPKALLSQLQNFDLALIAKPTSPFSDAEKYILDQFIVNGGKSVWLIDQVVMELDSLFNAKGSNMAVVRDLNLKDFFFKYGVRIEPILLNDLYHTPIVVAAGEANDSQYNPFPWIYHPMVFSRQDHPINKNITPLRLQFANVIDTLQNSNTKSILLRSSPLSKKEGVPQSINLDQINRIPKKEDYTNHEGYPLAVLLEGNFSSAFKNRIKPLQLPDAKEQGPDNSMLVVADGDIAKNQLKNGAPLELGYDKWTNSFYGNKEFLMNSINYMLDDKGLMNIRNKKVEIPLLDVQKVVDQKSKWQLITIGIPVLFILLGAMVNRYLRQWRYGA
ncbi:MAG: gliding motility-associated ABC transporter substrate-binding protein GldG [Bacteroidota bacterium]